jgi:hypothetical protein
MWLLGDIIDLNGDGVSSGYEVLIGDIIVISLLITANIVITRFFIKIRSTSTRIDAFMDDWYGEDPRPGITPRPGVLTRLHALEDDREANAIVLSDIQTTVNQIQVQVEHELNRNGGGSTKDAAHEALKVAKEVLAAQESAAEQQALFRSQYLADKQVSRQEWEAVFATVKEMIGKPVDEQMVLWTGASRTYLEDDGA